jgi:hypothetical protein
MERYAFICVKEVRGRSGRVWTEGEIFENPDGTVPEGGEIPGGDAWPSFWVQRRILDGDQGDMERLKFVSSGRSWVNWGGPLRPPMPPPVVDHDPQRDEYTTDEAATRNQTQRFFDNIKGWIPGPSQEEITRRQLAHLREFDPAAYDAIVAQDPSVAARTDAPPAELVLQPIRPPRAPADPGELERLLSEEQEAEKAGNMERLQEILEKISVVLG